MRPSMNLTVLLPELSKYRAALPDGPTQYQGMSRQQSGEECVSYLSLDCGDGAAVGARGRGHVCQVLDHLLRVLRLTGTRLTPGERRHGLMKDYV